MNIKNFEEAFSSNLAGCRRQCACGKEFYNPDLSWTWEDGELEELEASDAIPKDYAIGSVCFEGQEFVNACDCWHDRAIKIMKFIDSHSFDIARYLNKERERKLAEAESMPIVRGLEK